MRRTIGRLICEEGDEMVECDDGDEAPSLYERHRPDWVLLDMMMSDRGGVQAAQGILGIDAKARIIMVTDYGDRFFRKAAIDAGAVGFVAKENVAELKNIIRRASV